MGGIYKGVELAWEGSVSTGNKKVVAMAQSFYSSLTLDSIYNLYNFHLKYEIDLIESERNRPTWQGGKLTFL